MTRKEISLSELRNLACELGMELIYMQGKSKKKFAKVDSENYSPKKKIGLSRNGELYLLPINAEDMNNRLEKAVKRLKRNKNIAKCRELN